jgi:glyoxylase-like metal-dependent hydrolase (beta-lactamase superfamily II)
MGTATRLRALAAMLMVGIGASAHAQSNADQDRAIRQFRRDLYQVQAGRQVAVFLVTPEGILLVDPLGRPTALWLQSELAARFPGRPVKYVVHSHHHFDRAEGARVFEGTEVIAHREFNNEVAKAGAALPSFVAVTDSNLNGAFDAAEIAGSADASIIESRDRNSNGSVTPEELYSQVARVRTTYSRTLTISVGGSNVTLIHPGAAFARDMTVVYFPSERVVFAADAPPIAVTPFSFGPFSPGDVYEWLHAVVPLEFDTLLLGNGQQVARSELVALRDYLDDLRAGVAEAWERGDSMASTQLSPVVDRHQASPHYAGRSAQIAAVYRTLRVLKVQLGGAAASNYDRPARSRCAEYVTCAIGGAVPAASGSVAFDFSRTLGVAAELTLERQSWNTRSRALYDEEIALRQSRSAFLLRYSPRRRSSLSYAVVAGLSSTIGDARGMTLVRGAFVPTGGRHSIQTTETRSGYTAGVDLAFGRRVAFVVPVRVNYIASLPQYWPSRVNVRIGAGVAAQVLRRVR